MRGKWFVDPDVALSYFPLVFNILEGKTGEMAIDRPEFLLKAYSDNGNDNYSEYDDAPVGSIAVIPLQGSMVRYDTWCDYGTDTIAARLIEAANHPNISAIILRINSGGGSVDAINPLVEAIQHSQSVGKPIVAFVDDVCASAAYYVASFADTIIASNNISAMIGSIGVMITIPDYTEYYKQKGVTFTSLYAEQSDYKNKPFEEALKGNYDLIIKELLNPLAIRFQETVRINRETKLNDSTPGLLAGKMFFADEAITSGLIDSIGNFNAAIETAYQLSAIQILTNFNS